MEKKNLYERIVVGYDGSENSQRALDRALGIAKRSKTSVMIVTVVDNFPLVAFSNIEVYQKLNLEARNKAKEILSSAVNKAKQNGVDVKGEIFEGSPADSILSAASDFNADLIVVERRGIRGLKRFLMGSVSSYVVSNSQCDVLVVK
jgi:nucleotide-binding universal stress UspA family protein